jgi:hypothetical protein
MIIKIRYLPREMMEQMKPTTGNERYLLEVAGRKLRPERTGVSIERWTQHWMLSAAIETRFAPWRRRDAQQPSYQQPTQERPENRARPLLYEVSLM